MNCSLGTSVLMAVPADGCRSQLLLPWSGNGVGAVLAHLCPAILCRHFSASLLVASYQQCSYTGKSKQEATLGGEIKRCPVSPLNAKLHCEASYPREP